MGEEGAKAIAEFLHRSRRASDRKGGSGAGS